MIGAVANIVFNGVTGTGNTRSAFVMELAYPGFLYIIYICGRNALTFAGCYLFHDRGGVLYWFIGRKCYLFEEGVLDKIRKSDSEFVILFFIRLVFRTFALYSKKIK